MISNIKHEWESKGTDAIGDEDFYCSKCGKYASQLLDPWDDNCIEEKEPNV